MKFEHTETRLSLESEFPKLVRDKIPELIKQREGREVQTRVLTDDKEFLAQLQKKLAEEAEEFSEAKNDANLVEEIADIFEIIDTIVALRGISIDDVRQVQSEKRQERGGFEDRLLMLGD